MIQQITPDMLSEFNSLTLAINKLFEKQEKSHGCFQVKKEGEFCALNIPSLPSFKFYQNPKSLIYRGYWRTTKGLLKPTDTKNFPPDLWIKKKQKQVQVSSEAKTISSQETAPKQWIDQSKPIINPRSSTRKNQVTKKQRIYEIVYRYHTSSEVMRASQIIALCLREKIIADIVSVPESEIMPLVLVGNPQ